MMLKKLLITICIFFFSSFSVYAVIDYEVDEIPIDVDGFVDIDSTSTVSVTPDTNEVGVFSNVGVRILDRNSNPLSGHTVTIYVTGNPAEITFEQPAGVTNTDGWIFGKVKSSLSGSYVISARDTTFAQDITIQDTANFHVFPISSPHMQDEPFYTPGTTNRVYWNLIAGYSTYQYYVGCSKQNNFSTVISNSGWITGNNYTFTNLSGAQMYYYRVRARNAGGVVSGWSNVVFSLQDSVPPTIEYVSIERVMDEGKVSSVSVVFDVTDDFEVNSVQFSCFQQNNELEVCGTVSNVGSRYYVDIPLADLEKGAFGSFYDKYTFCVDAYDKAGNTSQSCDFSIEIAEYVDFQYPVFTNVANSIIKFVNDSVSDIGKGLSNIFNQASQAILQALSIVLLILVVIIALSIFAGGLFVFPTLLLSFFFRLIYAIGFKKQGKYLGYVYNSITGKVVPYVKVTCYDNKNQRVFSSVTNRHGEFFGDVEVGKFRIIASNPHYLFPSELYKEVEMPKAGKLYTSGYVMVAEKNPMNVAIPLDPINMYRTWDEKTVVEKRIGGLMKAIVSLLLVIGLAVSIYTLERFKTVFNLALVIVYFPVLWMFLRSILSLKGFVKR